MEEKRRIPELDGLRVIMIAIVSWYHIWQQSWLMPAAWLDFLPRSGYVWVDGTILLSAFLLYLPLARKGRSGVPDIQAFYIRKAKRILPGYWFIILVFFFGMCLPWGLYQGNGPFMVKDLVTHLTLIFPFFQDTYIFTPMGAAPWTLSVVAQAYLIFPLLAAGMRKRPAVTLLVMAAIAGGFRAWCLWGLSDYAMVVNALVNFLDVYALGFMGAILFARLERLPAAESRGKTLGRQLLATAVFFACGTGLILLLRKQAGVMDHARLQASQMTLRPAFAAMFAGLVVSAPLCVKPLKVLLGNPATKFLAEISMNYYLIHQTLAVHMRRMGFPASVSATPNTAGERPWQISYTVWAFALSLAAAVFVTYAVEKPLRKRLDRKRAV